ncbi:FGGY family carbohydrate kinase [Jiella pacifica]|uniref:Carbohydrate kinase n=1 Tax=Jiella pacifica TaxID=2696469 RepID=A0A6N9T3W3_9HYPH|nr:FGGY family carbohydrate kinase [Jiella pacifica]NDW04509.1 carbohydrate kinase [Jiella pacifica]
MNPVLLCLDSGTTAVKAAAFDGSGRLLAAAERPNRALRRSAERVEQDMGMSRQDGFAVLRDCASQLSGPVAGIVVTGQGDGLWPVGEDLEPVGQAMTWLDGRCRALAGDLAEQGALDEIRLLTGSRPTSASQSLQLFWLSRNEPERFAKIRFALRLKEWLFLGLTGKAMAEPSAVLPVWGNWRTGATSRLVEVAIGLNKGIALLPELAPIDACTAFLSGEAAAEIGIAGRDIPVLLGPGDVQTTLIGLGLGTRPGVSRASIFGTSAIHACHITDAGVVPTEPAGAMVQQFALGEGYLCFHPSFNGATLMSHLGRLMAGVPERSAPHYSDLILHPFFEPGGERAPVTTPHATGAIFGLTAQTRPEEIAWAAREALAFVARKSHDMMNAPAGALSLGGGLAGDATFASFLATLLGAKVERTTTGHASLRGLGTIGAKFLLGASDAEIASWIGPPDEAIEPGTGPVRDYAMAKYDLFVRLLDAVAPNWEAFSALRRQAVMKEPCA